MIRKAIYIIFTAGLVACSTNTWLVSVFYNRIDNQMVDRFTEYADFNEQQLAMIEAMVSSYHYWHRTSQLPRYAGLLRQFEAELALGMPISRDLAKSWMDEVLAFSNAVESCNPLNTAFALMGSLSDAQVEQIAAELERTYETYMAELENQDPQQQQALRIKRISKWLGRAGLRLDSAQQSLLRETVAQHKSFKRDGLELWRAWNGEFIDLLKIRESEAFADRMALHMAGLWNLSRDRYPQEWSQNYELWVDFFHQLFNLQSDRQRAAFSRWSLAMADTLEQLAKAGDGKMPVVVAAEYERCDTRIRMVIAAAGVSEKSQRMSP